ncbi:MAG: glycosyltransferase family 2 protein [Dokdonella sp.]
MKTGLISPACKQPQLFSNSPECGGASAHASKTPAASGDPWLSILIPVFNVAGYLQECLDSIASQLEPGIEIVALDDASTDDGAAILAQNMRSPGSVVRVVSLTRNEGLAAARNRLVKEARGDYCWFVDADDLMCSGAIRSLRGVIEADSPDLVMCDFRVLRQRIRLKHRLRGELHRRSFDGPSRTLSTDREVLIGGILNSGQLHSWSKIARRSIWSTVRFPEGRYFEDIAVFPQLTAAVCSHVHVPEPWIAYRQREGSILSEITPEKIRDQLRALRDMGGALDPAQTDPTGYVGFAQQNFLLRRLASLMRGLAKDSTVEGAALRTEVNENLCALFPGGIDGILDAYRRRGWILRAWRARQSLQEFGLQTCAHP